MDKHGGNFQLLSVDEQVNGRANSIGGSTKHSFGTLIDLGEAMHSVVHEAPTDIPAGYTYLGQFINHDVHSLRDIHQFASGNTSAGNYVNNTTQYLDLSTVYAKAGWDQQSDLQVNKSTGCFILGVTQNENGEIICGSEDDLPREFFTKKALIQDQRNDENLLVAQLHVQFLKLHNYFASNSGSNTAKLKYEDARIQTVAFYKSIVVHDFLKTLLCKDVWALYFSDNAASELGGISENDIEKARNCPIFYKNFVPLEFSVAAFRFGHSMVRKNYRINDKINSVSLDEIFRFTGKTKLHGHNFLPTKFVVDWARFFDFAHPSLQKALEIKPSTIIEIPSIEWPANRLAIRNLFRSQSLNVLTGQETVLSILDSNLPQQIKDLVQDNQASGDNLDMIVAFVTGYDATNCKVNTEVGRLLDRVCSKEKIISSTPLWYYILIETFNYPMENESGAQVPKLGPTASIIIAETFYNLMKFSENEGSSCVPQEVRTMLDLLNLIKD